MENQMTYPVEVKDIIDQTDNLKNGIFEVYNKGFIDGVKEGQRIALKAMDKYSEKSK